MTGKKSRCRGGLDVGLEGSLRGEKRPLLATTVFHGTYSTVQNTKGPVNRFFSIIKAHSLPCNKIARVPNRVELEIFYEKVFRKTGGFVFAPSSLSSSRALIIGSGGPMWYRS